MSGVDIFAFLAARISDPRTGWSLGTFGAIAEFTRDREEPVELARAHDVLSAVTPRGGIRVAPLADMQLFASESTTRESWNQRIALCLRSETCAMSGRTVLTEVGPDDAALRDQDRHAILFDLGLDALQVDACIRVSDPSVAARLRAHVGRPVFEAGNPAMGVILASSPHRVFLGRLGRIEVFQPIPPPDGTSPDGPHTHVLPRLLQHRRTHAATEPIPDGWVPCAHLYPPHPAKDDQGRARPFDPVRHDAFQDMLRIFGDPALFAHKQRVIAAVEAGDDPLSVAVAGNRHAHACVRIALRQMKASRKETPSLLAWLSIHDPRAEHDINDEDVH